MDGGKEPLRDGDWAILRVARSAPAHLHPRSAASEPHEPLSG
jgi:hypothetical protein